MNSNTSHTACTDANTLSAHHIARIPCTTSVAQVIVSLHFSRAMSHAMHGAPSTSSSSFSSVQALQRLLTSSISCADRRERGGDGYTDPEPRTVYEPNREQEDITCTEDNQIAEIEGHVKSLSYNQSLLSSTQDSIESLATPQEQTWTTNKFVLCWLHHGSTAARSRCGTIASLSL